MTMKRYLALAGLTVGLCALAGAQDTGDRIVVPARNTTHPRVVEASVTHGSITVKVYNGKEVIVQSGSDSRKEKDKDKDKDRMVDGLRRIDMPARGFSIEEEDNVIHIRASSAQSQNLVITVPVDTSLQLKSTHGTIMVDGVHGEVEVSDTNGEIELTNISGTVVADTTNGSIKVSMVRVDPNKPIAFSSINGTVDVTLPADLKANMKLRTNRGEVWSDFDMKLTGGQPTTTGGGNNGRFKLEFDRTIYGTINGGGVEANFRTINGKILIRKK